MESSTPWRRWILLALVAIGGSLFYGATLAHMLPKSDLLRGALWLTLSAGTGWILLGPALILFAQKPISVVADACLVAMACGEVVLAIGGVLNLALVTGIPFNIVVVAMSNVLMAGVLAARLKENGVHPATTLACWFIVLDGGGAAAFWILYRLLFGGHA
ncbi:hypothetical protein [Fimbriimonas ginsengisoli]|uniref:Uncharacterized protein n=1 Tax=Fimbriimonas ginsengisoli Gsoil 348 TaxID=661478 RepID=A0A068NWH8_FIMGI|nr:hypothetical protein [Fimbriimonas ginsengisoli]AIE85954.1 hypothetical protein OP10G_2586 [Fimbriimonas ginsengisoli Gsoil 348]